MNRITLDVEDGHLLKSLENFKRTQADTRHDCLHLILGDNLEMSTTRGKATSTSMCSFSNCVGFTRDSPNLQATETARTISHELGHNLGLRHDTEECICQDCIMATGIEFGSISKDWSLCSLQDLPVLLENGMGVCLHDIPLDRHTGLVPISDQLLSQAPTSVRVFTDHANLPMQIPGLVHSVPSQLIHSLCGNGKLDFGEECDCGNSDMCPIELQDCCDVTTCRLINQAECAGGSCCDVTPIDLLNKNGTAFQCRLKSRGSVCRDKSNACDLPEFCDGKDEWCPSDVYKVDGEKCYTEKGYLSYCVRGGCHSRADRCQTLWGDTGSVAGSTCTMLNQAGDWIGSSIDDVANCGRIRPFKRKERFESIRAWPNKPCISWANAECGRLWCVHQNEKAMLIGWKESKEYSDLSSSRVCSGLVYDPVWPFSDPLVLEDTGDVLSPKVISHYADPNWGYTAANTQDAGMVPDGTPCSQGLCFNGSCVDKSSLPFRKSCNCASRGVCNNRGNCHCFEGFAPPHCLENGDGGSIDSGPPTHSFIRYRMIAAVLFIVFILTPIFGITLFCLLCRCENGKLILPKSGPVILVTPETSSASCNCKKLFTHIRKSCRKIIPTTDTQYPVICAFGHQYSTVNKTIAPQKFIETKKVIDATEPKSCPDYIKELSNNIENSFNRKPSYLKHTEQAWRDVEMQQKVDISHPTLTTTTYNGGTTTLYEAVRSKQKNLKEDQKIENRQRDSLSNNNKQTTFKRSFNPSTDFTPKLSDTYQTAISTPYLQNTTYKHDLIELHEAASSNKPQLYMGVHLKNTGKKSSKSRKNPTLYAV